MTPPFVRGKALRGQHAVVRTVEQEDVNCDRIVLGFAIRSWCSCCRVSSGLAQVRDLCGIDDARFVGTMMGTETREAVVVILAEMVSLTTRSIHELSSVH